MEDAYQVLGVDSNISDEDLKKIYRQLAKKYHPDKLPNETNKLKMVKINSAYSLIKKARNIK
ncbi:J domain-containing protein [Williamsoniiplasma lucivorax]|uniref:J domain-containing protein n=1 Tax=Williamsoniiplasma lucivorax TaxID=209274 RepID=UPI000CE5AD87|nr:DnaJ domain-containing protein [Williamsoniiplasma lucivorax]